MQIRSVMTSYCLQLKIVKCWKNNISRNTKAVFLKLGTTIVHHKRNKMTLSAVAIATLSAPFSFCPKNESSICNLLSVFNINFFSASEKRAFLLYYATPLLSSYLPSDHLFFLMLLTGGVFRLLKQSITQTELQEAHTYLKLFSAQAPVFYGKICICEEFVNSYTWRTGTH